MMSFSPLIDSLSYRLPVGMAALVLASIGGLITGPLAYNAGPFFLLVTDKLFGGLGGRLDRPERKPADLIMRGFFLTVLACAIFALAGFSAVHAAAFVPYRIGEAVLLSLLLSSGAVWRFIASLHGVLKTGKGRYLTLARSTRTDFSSIDDYAMTRAAIAYGARSFDKAVVAPLFWYLLGGLPIAYIYAGLAALVWRFGRDGHGGGFGALPQGIEAIMGTIPNALSGIFLSLAALLTPSGNIVRAFFGLLNLKRRVPYAEGGFAVMTMAWALKIGLGGPVTDLDGRTLSRRWAGPANATARLDHGYLLRALYLSVVATLLVLAALTVAWLALTQNAPVPLALPVKIHPGNA